ncbi:hypothetical protein MHYP_G00145520 [Metynnis hypsauchen]
MLNTMYSVSLLLFLATASSVECIELVQPAAMFVKPGQSFSIACVHSIELIQSDNVVVRPGESFKISCKFSGFSLSSYCPRWIRHSAGKPMEYIGYVCSSGSSVKDSLKSKISFTADASSSTVFLTGQNFQPEDSAMYYCARETQSFNLQLQLYKNTAASVFSSSGISLCNCRVAVFTKFI